MKKIALTIFTLIAASLLVLLFYIGNPLKIVGFKGGQVIVWKTPNTPTIYIGGRKSNLNI